MKITHKYEEQEEPSIELPFLMELITWSAGKYVPTGLVVLMVEPGKGMVVVTSEDERYKGNEKGQWCTHWNKKVKPYGVNNYWTPWSGTVTLEND